MMLSLTLQRVFAAVLMGLMMLSPAMASDLMFGTLQFRRRSDQCQVAPAIYRLQIMVRWLIGCWLLKAALRAKPNFTQWTSQMAL
jgi:hypothetical protein